MNHSVFDARIATLPAFELACIRPKGAGPAIHRAPYIHDDIHPLARAWSEAMCASVDRLGGVCIEMVEDHPISGDIVSAIGGVGLSRQAYFDLPKSEMAASRISISFEMPIGENGKWMSARDIDIARVHGAALLTSVIMRLSPCLILDDAVSGVVIGRGYDASLLFSTRIVMRECADKMSISRGDSNWSGTYRALYDWLFEFTSYQPRRTVRMSLANAA